MGMTKNSVSSYCIMGPGVGPAAWTLLHIRAQFTSTAAAAVAIVADGVAQWH